MQQHEQLRQFNRWRRGEDDSPQPNATEIGKLLDSVADRLEAMETATPIDPRIASMGVEQALRWADHNCAPEAVERLRSRKVAQVLARCVREQQAQIAELAAAFTEIWIADDHAAWDPTAVAYFDALMARHNAENIVEAEGSE
jgi:hypothetical protein